MRLEGKVALFTGAAKGIGESIAWHFAAEGAFVYVTDIDQDNGQRVATPIEREANMAASAGMHNANSKPVNFFI